MRPRVNRVLRISHPPQYAQYLRRDGFTVLNSANNHSHDFGEQGVLDTSAALKAAGIAQTGLPGQIAIVHDGVTTVAFVGFAPYTNTNNMLDFGAAKALIEKASSEADIVVVYMHAGAEGSQADHVTGQEEYYVGEDRGNPEAFRACSDKRRREHGDRQRATCFARYRVL